MLRLRLFEIDIARQFAMPPFRGNDQPADHERDNTDIEPGYGVPSLRIGHIITMRDEIDYIMK